MVLRPLSSNPVQPCNSGLGLACAHNAHCNMVVPVALQSHVGSLIVSVYTRQLFQFTHQSTVLTESLGGKPQLNSLQGSWSIHAFMECTGGASLVELVHTLATEIPRR